MVVIIRSHIVLYCVKKNPKTNTVFHEVEKEKPTHLLWTRAFFRNNFCVCFTQTSSIRTKKKGMDGKVYHVRIYHTFRTEIFIIYRERWLQFHPQISSMTHHSLLWRFELGRFRQIIIMCCYGRTYVMINLHNIWRILEWKHMMNDAQTCMGYIGMTHGIETNSRVKNCLKGCLKYYRNIRKMLPKTFPKYSVLPSWFIMNTLFHPSFSVKHHDIPLSNKT